MLYNYKSNNRTYCRCRCDCGKEVIKERSGLLKSKQASCGCMDKFYNSTKNRRDDIGKKYGRLTIIDVDYETSGYAVAKCICDCGNTIYRRKADVTCKRGIRSCGCLQKEMASIAVTKDYTNFVSLSGVKIIDRAYKDKVWMWNCVCPLCGSTFIALPAKIISNHTTSCGCKIKSKFERIIETFLTENGIIFETQKTFEDCRNKRLLRFDFALYSSDGRLKCLIEYDGAQHYKPSLFFGGEASFKETTSRDQIKNDYCITNNIRLIRFSYTDTIEKIKNTIINIDNA